MSIARIENYNGSPAFMIDGKPYPPIMATVSTTKENKRHLDEEYYKNLGKSGIKIFFVIQRTQNTLMKLHNIMAFLQFR